MRGTALTLTCVLLLSGCWIGPDEVAWKVDRVSDTTDTDTDTGDTDDTDDPGPLVLESVSPAYGTNAGGLVITVVAPGVDEKDVKVEFAGVEAEVLSVTGDVVKVTLPEVSSEGRVDVTIDSADRDARLTRGFYYWKDGTDLTGLVGVVRNYDLDRDYLSSEPQMRSATLYYIDPFDFSWSDLYAGGVDRCALNWDRPGPSLDLLVPGIPKLSLSNAAETVELLPENGEAFRVELEEGWFEPGSTFDLEQDAGDDGWPGFALDGVAVMPRSGFRVTSPDMESERPLVTSFGNVNLRWTTAGAGDLVLVSLVRYDLVGSPAEEISCVLSDDGSHDIPMSLFNDWAPSGYLVFQVHRVIESEAVLPFNNANVGVYGSHVWYGEAIQAF